MRSGRTTALTGRHAYRSLPGLRTVGACMLMVLSVSDCTCGAASAPCPPGSYVTCPCPGSGASGFQVCDGAGTGFGPCQCATTDVFVDIDISAEPTNAVFAVENMAPGDVASRALRVSNRGRAELRYAFISVASGDALAGQLAMTVRLSPEGHCDEGGNGATVYGPGPAGSTVGVEVFGSPLTGAQSGDRNLAPDSVDVWCIDIALPLDTPDDYQGASTQLSFNLIAEQTLNNP